MCRGWYLVVLRVDRRPVVGDAVRARYVVEDGLLDERVERDAFVLGLLREHLRIVLVAGRHAEVDVEAHVLVGELALVFAQRHGMAVEHHRGLEVGVVVTRGPGPGDETKHEEEDRREERDDDRLLATLALPPRHALTLRETWKWDTTCHGRPKCTG